WGEGGVASGGWTGMSTLGRGLSPTFSPMNSIGASSRSPSPITMVPSIGSLLSSRRIASTAAWSAAFSLPWPRSRAADTAARSVTRTISSVRMRSSKSWGGTEIWVDILALLRISSAGPPACKKHSCRAMVRTNPLILLDPDHLRLAADHLVALHGRERTIHRVLMGGVSNQQHRHRRSLSRGLRGVAAVRMTLHDGFDGNLLFGKARRYGCCSACEIARHQSNIVAAFVTLHRRLLRRAQALHRAAERIDANAARDIGDVGKHSGGRRGTAGAGTDQRDGWDALA